MDNQHPDETVNQLIKYDVTSPGKGKHIVTIVTGKYSGKKAIFYELPPTLAYFMHSSFTEDEINSSPCVANQMK